METNKERRMKSGVMVHPKKPKEIIIAILLLAVVLGSVAPVINLVNLPILVFGMPLLMVWCIGIIIVVPIILALANYWKVW